ncbi:MAG: Hsp70 family protein [Terracidiphilus sp.]
MPKCIGIHLGATNAIAAIRTENGVRVLQNRESQDLTPCVVSEYKGRTVVGQMALDRQGLAPHDTVDSIRRLMGRGFYDVNVQKAKARAAYAVLEAPGGADGDVRVMMGGNCYSPVEVSSMILRKMKEDIELRLGETVEYAVITAPAYFADAQRAAIRRAGQLAGLKVQKILDEPIAAALAFGAENVRLGESKTLLIYDLGAESLDVSVMTVGNGALVLLNIEGDPWLGGNDFNSRIMEHVLRRAREIYGIDGASDTRFMAELKRKAEQAKRMLSHAPRTDILVLGTVKNEEGEPIDVDVEITRLEFESLIAPEVARTMEIVRRAIVNAGEAMTPDRIDQVLLVGGSTHIPFIQASLASLFGSHKLVRDVDPVRCMAYGAAIYADGLAQRIECPCGHVNAGEGIVCETCGEPLVASDGIVLGPPVTPVPYGVGVRCEASTDAGDHFEIVIPEGQPLPLPDPIRRIFRTDAPGLRRVFLPIYAGFNPAASRNELQATLWIALPPGLAAGTPIEVAFSLDEDGILRNLPARLLDGSDIELGTYLDRGSNLRSRLERMLEDLRAMKAALGKEADPQTRQRWDALYDHAVQALNTGNHEAAKCSLASLEELLANTPKC